MERSISVLFAVVALSVGTIASPQSGDASKSSPTAPKGYQSQVLKVVTPDQITAKSKKPVVPAPGLLPHAVFLEGGARSLGSVQSQSVTVSLSPGSDALVMCEYANSTSAANAPASCGITSPSFHGATIPDVHKVPAFAKTVLIESKSGKITLGCNGQAPVTCQAMVYW